MLSQRKVGSPCPSHTLVPPPSTPTSLVFTDPLLVLFNARKWLVTRTWVLSLCERKARQLSPRVYLGPWTPVLLCLGSWSPSWGLVWYQGLGVCVCVGVGSGGKVPEWQHALASTCLHGDVVFSDFWIRDLQLRFRTTLQIPSEGLQYGG